MSVVTQTERKQIVSVAFDEACDAVAAGHPDRAQGILERAMPDAKIQARQILEAILAHHVATHPLS